MVASSMGKKRRRRVRVRELLGFQWRSRRMPTKTWQHRIGRVCVYVCYLKRDTKLFDLFKRGALKIEFEAVFKGVPSILSDSY